MSFELAATVFHDPLVLTVFDDEHSDDEERWLTLGCAQNGMHLVVSQTSSPIDVTNARIHIISARKANKLELRDYQYKPR